MLLTGLIALAAAAPAPVPAVLSGRSAQGRPLRAVRVGAQRPGAPRLLVVGAIHGNELAGRAVTRALRPIPGVEVWRIHDLNPDGARRRTRQNARGVDLNRNFPRGWRARGRPGSTFHSGRRPLSEPESAFAARVVRRLRPDVTVWFHQHLRMVNLSQGADPRVVRRYAHVARLPVRKLPNYPGTATRWQNTIDGGASAFVVELPAGPLSRAGARRHLRALAAVAARRQRGSRMTTGIVRSPARSW